MAGRRIASLASALALGSGALGLLTALSSAAAPAGASVAAFNWVLVEATVPHTQVPATLEIDLTLTGARAGESPDAIGRGLSWHSGRDTTVNADRVQPRVTVTGTGGGQGVGLDRAGALAASSEWYRCSPCAMVAGDVVRYLFFETDARFDSVQAGVTMSGEALPVTVTTGSGATALLVAPPAGQGAGVGTPAGSTGTSNQSVVIPDGAAGSFTNGCLAGPCSASWDAPLGVRGHVEWTGDVFGSSTSGTPSFAGPPGAWAFTWTGTTTDAVLAAYAPIGAAWQYFAA